MSTTDPWSTRFAFHDDKAEITAEKTPDGTVGILHLSGQLATENSPAVTAHLQQALDANPLPATVILDARHLRYASSTGIGVIARLLVELQNRSVSLQLANVGENVREVFDLLGFSAFFQFVDWP
ncbi:MAG: STAS domain-containing protein [Alkalispirochaeta sp.]